MSESYTPLYKQEVIWLAEYTDGIFLREWEESGKENLFKDIDRSKLKAFHLVSADSDYFFDCKTGVFNIDGREFVFPLTGLNLDYAGGLIHFKTACTELTTSNNPYAGFSIHGYEMGWKATYHNFKCQVIFYNPKKEFKVELTFLDLQRTVKWNVQI